MHAPQHLFSHGPVILLLLLFLSLGTSMAQKEGDSIISLSMTVPESVKPNEVVELKVTVTNNVDKCMVVKISTKDNPSIDYPEGHMVYTACVCDIHNYYWFFTASESTVIEGTAEVVSDGEICPPNEELYPEVGYQASGTVCITVEN